MNSKYHDVGFKIISSVAEKLGIDKEKAITLLIANPYFTDNNKKQKGFGPYKLDHGYNPNHKQDNFLVPIELRYCCICGKGIWLEVLHYQQTIEADGVDGPIKYFINTRGCITQTEVHDKCADTELGHRLERLGAYQSQRIIIDIINRIGFSPKVKEIVYEQLLVLEMKHEINVFAKEVKLHKKGLRNEAQATKRNESQGAKETRPEAKPVVQSSRTNNRKGRANNRRIAQRSV